MMSSDKPLRYYALRLTRDTSLYQRGDEICCADKPLTIGETADCDVRLDRADPHLAAEPYAAILPMSDGAGWIITPLSDSVAVNVSGHGRVTNAITLRDGDAISFGDNDLTLRFSTRSDDDSATLSEALRRQASIVRPAATHSLKRVYLLIAMLAAAIVGITLWITLKPSPMSRSDVDEYASSVYMITPDSVYCVMTVNGVADSTVWSIECDRDNRACGTAFLTADSLLITARHCAEYWIGERLDPLKGLSDYADDDIIRLVAEAETYNYTHIEGDTAYRIGVICSVSKPEEHTSATFRINTLTDSVVIDRSRDHILPFDNFYSRFYWRTILPYYTNRKMQSGDLLVAKTDRHGEITLASEDEVAAIEHDTEVGLLGYPQSDTQSRQLDFTSGRFDRGRSDAEDMMVVHKGDAAHGYSGSPVFVKRSGKSPTVIGILSRNDHIDASVKYSVSSAMLETEKFVNL